MLENFPFDIILGSASPRRQELLKSLNLSFKVNPINADEDFPIELKREEIPIYLAEKKSIAYKKELSDKELLITSDTIVWHNHRVLNKPKDYKEAILMLSELSGNTHEVFTGVCVRGNNILEIFSDSTKVFFRKLEKKEIEYYVNNYNVYDKAGGYGAQDWIGNVAIDKIEGSYFNVMGLPVHKLYKVLKNISY